MFNRYGANGEAADSEGVPGRQGHDPGLAASPLGFPKDIGKTLPQFRKGRGVGVERESLFPAQRADIVQAVEMIRMGMGQEYRIEPGNPRPEGLEPEFRPRIDDQPFPALPQDVEGSPGPLIRPLRGTAHRAVAADHRNAVGSA
jgi:hypothetical protein